VTSPVAVTVKTTVRDRGAEKLLGNLLRKGALSVGVLAGDAAHVHEAKTDEGRIGSIFKGFDKQGFEKKGEAKALTIGEIAEIHEFGLGSCPRRSFLADWADEEQSQINTVVIRGAQALASGKLSSPIQFLEQVGAWAVGSIQQRMASNIPPPLSPVTIRRKGSSVALIDTGQLRSSISYRVDAAESGKGKFTIVTTGETIE
jgi:hypothetical protein